MAPQNDTAFTPGPWRVDFDPVGVRWEVWAGARPPATGPIATAHHSDINHRFPSEANARLIAAAPELFEALAELLSGHDNLYVAHFGPNADPRNDIATKAARAVLAKAGKE